MLSQRVTVSVPKLLKRNFGIVAPALQQASDPIQQLFIDKIREYKAKSSSGKVDMSPQLQAERKQELEKVAKQFGGGEGVNMTEFPKLSFPDAKIQSQVGTESQ